MIRSRSAALALLAGCLGSHYTVPTVQARTFSVERSGCLFELAHPPQEIPPQSAIHFSFLPLGIGSNSSAPASENAALLPDNSMTVQAELTTDAPPRLPVLAGGETQKSDPTDDWPVFRAFRHWQTPGIAGLSRPFRTASSVFALDYSDIFETGRAAYKGGHGISLFFRHQF